MSENFEAEQNTDGANPDVRELSEVPAVEVISRAAVMLMSSAAEKLGLSDAIRLPAPTWTSTKRVASSRHLPDS